jgi:hypothetical protein
MRNHPLLLAAAGIVTLLPLAACQPEAAITAAPAAAAAECPSPEITWHDVLRAKRLADVRVVTVGADGERVEGRVAGYPKLVTPHASTPDAEAVATLVEDLAQQVPGLQSQPGPSLTSMDGVAETLAAGRYVVYSGAVVVDAEFDRRCAADGEITRSGKLRSWTAPAAGILRCGLAQRPDAGTFGALAEIYCATA